MIDPTPHERAAMNEAAGLVGEYLEHIGTTDIVTMTPEQYDMMIEAAITGYVEALQRLTGHVAPPEPPVAPVGGLFDDDIPF